MTNFSGKLVSSSSQAALVYLVTAQANGKPAWYYLQVSEPKHNAFKTQLKTGTLDVADFGKVLYSGWGDTPPDAIHALIKEQFDAAA